MRSELGRANCALRTKYYTQSKFPPRKMTTSKPQLAVSRKIYWLCQAGGWLAFALIEFLFSMSGQHAPAHPTRLAAEWTLAAFDGLLGTHLLYLHMKRQHWLQWPGSTVLLRFLFVIPFLAAILDSLDWFYGSLLQSEPAMHFPVYVPLIFLTWGNWTIVLVSWTALYLAIHEFRQRRERELRGLRIELVAQEAQLRALRAQLNPHFLFNCLNGLREMIEVDHGRAQVMVEQLSALLRYSLQTNQREMVSLAEEIRAVEDYLALESIRFEERLHVRWDISPEARQIKLPPMLLQTLVENALKHGIASRLQGGEIVITACTLLEELKLEVTNSGTIGTSQPTIGVGLKNAKERLNLLYGQRASLSLDDAGDDCVSAVVLLPLVPPGLPS